MIKPEVVKNEDEREMLLIQYLTVAHAALGEGTSPEALVPTMIELITQDLAHLLQTPDSDPCGRQADGAPVEIPVLDSEERSNNSFYLWRKLNKMDQKVNNQMTNGQAEEQPTLSLLARHMRDQMISAGIPIKPDATPVDLLKTAISLKPETREYLLAEAMMYMDRLFDDEEAIDFDTMALAEDLSQLVETNGNGAEAEAEVEPDLAQLEVELTDGGEDQLFDIDEALAWTDLLAVGHLNVPDLVPDQVFLTGLDDIATDEAQLTRLIARQKEMMDTCFDGIGEEKKAERRAGLAAQQLQVEQQHALKMLLGFDSAQALTAHLQRCLEDTSFGYGPNGNNGRTTAQALQAVAEVAEQPFEDIVESWWLYGSPFRAKVLEGFPISARPLFDDTSITSFAPVFRLVAHDQWMLGLEGQGKTRAFEGPFLTICQALWDTFAQWSEEDLETWLADVRKEQARRPASLHHAGWAAHLTKNITSVERDGNTMSLKIERIPTDEAWPRSVVFGNALAISRLTGHGFYELVWDGGHSIRRFEVSSTSQNKLPIDHTEVAIAYAEVIAGVGGPRPEAATPEEIEAAYISKMKLEEVTMGPPTITALPGGRLEGRPVAEYKAGDVSVHWIVGGNIIAYGVRGNNTDRAFVLEKSEKTGLLAIKEVQRGRIRPQPVMVVTAADIGEGKGWNKAVASWLAWVTMSLINK